MSVFERALVQLAAEKALLAPLRAGRGYGVYPGGDRRRRPLAKLSASEVQALASDGTLQRGEQDCFSLSAAGRARLRRLEARPSEAFVAQHAPIADRAVMDEAGAVRAVRGLEASAVLRRLSALRDHQGRAWLSGAELDIAQKLRADWEAAQSGLVRGSDWSAPPLSASARGAGNAQERSMAARCDARRRLADALDALSPPLRRVVERVCLCEEGLEAIERAEHWPTRSGKLALKLGLAQLAQAMAR